MTPQGVRLNGMTGIACILRMALPDLDDLLDESDDGDIDSDDEGRQNAVAASDSESISSPKKKSDNTGSVGAGSSQMEMTDNDYMEDIFGELGIEEGKEEDELDIEEMLKPS